MHTCCIAKESTYARNEFIQILSWIITHLKFKVMTTEQHLLLKLSWFEAATIRDECTMSRIWNSNAWLVLSYTFSIWRWKREEKTSDWSRVQQKINKRWTCERNSPKNGSILISISIIHKAKLNTRITNEFRGWNNKNITANQSIDVYLSL